jgi:hypothetical protein
VASETIWVNSNDLASSRESPALLQTTPRRIYEIDSGSIIRCLETTRLQATVDMAARLPLAFEASFVAL